MFLISKLSLLLSGGVCSSASIVTCDRRRDGASSRKPDFYFFKGSGQSAVIALEVTVLIASYRAVKKLLLKLMMGTPFIPTMYSVHLPQQVSPNTSPLQICSQTAYAISRESRVVLSGCVRRAVETETSRRRTNQSVHRSVAQIRVTRATVVDRWRQLQSSAAPDSCAQKRCTTRQPHQRYHPQSEGHDFAK